MSVNSLYSRENIIENFPEGIIAKEKEAKKKDLNALAFLAVTACATGAIFLFVLARYNTHLPVADRSILILSPSFIWFAIGVALSIIAFKQAIGLARFLRKDLGKKESDRLLGNEAIETSRKIKDVEETEQSITTQNDQATHLKNVLKLSGIQN